MPEFNASPRPSKRRKTATYGSNRSMATSPSSKPPSVLRSLSNAVSGISRRLFETPTKRANAALSIDSANKSTEIGFDGWDDSLKANEVDGEREDRDLHDGGTWTERSTTSEREAAKEGDITPARNTREASRPEKSSRGDNGSQRRSSVRRLKGNEEVLAKDPLPNRTTGSPPERQMTSHADMTGVKAPKSSMRVAMRASPSGVPVALPKTKKSGIFASTNLMAEELATRNEAKDNRDAVVFNQRSSGREKRKPRRYSADVEDMAEQHRKMPVGILTPSKRDKNGARKSVAFEEDEQRVEDHICFKDVEECSQASRSGKRKSKARSTRSQVALETEPLGLKHKRGSSRRRKRIRRGEEEEEEEERINGRFIIPRHDDSARSASHHYTCLDFATGIGRRPSLNRNKGQGHVTPDKLGSRATDQSCDGVCQSAFPPESHRCRWGR